jgi:hypothetical protein
MTVLVIKEVWYQFQIGCPGKRVQERHKRKSKATSEKASLRRFLRPAAGILLIIVGIVLLILPGPGLPFVFLGGFLLAERFLAIAKLMDWLELRIRSVCGSCQKCWIRAPLFIKIMFVALVLGLLTGFGCAGYWFFLRR